MHLQEEFMVDTQPLTKQEDFGNAYLNATLINVSSVINKDTSTTTVDWRSRLTELQMQWTWRQNGDMSNLMPTLAWCFKMMHTWQQEWMATSKQETLLQQQESSLHTTRRDTTDYLFVCLLPLIYKVFHAVYCRIERSVWLVGGNTEGLREPEFESECGRTFIQVPTQIKRTLPIRSAKTILIKLGIVRANNLHIS